MSSPSKAPAKVSPRVSFKEYPFIRPAQDFEPLQYPLLGKGCLGSVRLVKDTKTGTKYAMKAIDKRETADPVSLAYIKSEIKIQRTLDHPYITKLEFCCEDEQFLYLVLTYAENGSLYQYLRNKRRPLTEPEAFLIFAQAANALEYLHMKNVIHRDLKPANILLDGKGNVKICDFGWSVLEYSAANSASLSGTLDYIAPEVLLGEKSSFASDVWSLGVVFYELLHGCQIFGNGTESKRRAEMVKNGEEIPLKSEVSANCQHLLRQLLAHDPASRITLSQVFTSEFMKHHGAKMQLDFKAMNASNLERVKSDLSSPLSASLQQSKFLDFTISDGSKTRKSTSPSQNRKSLGDNLWKGRNSQRQIFTIRTRVTLPTKSNPDDETPDKSYKPLDARAQVKFKAPAEPVQKRGFWPGLSTYLESFGCVCLK